MPSMEHYSKGIKILLQLKNFAMKVLRTTIKKEWFEKIVRGEKKQEFRDYSPYWEKRLMNINEEEGIEEFIKYDAVEFINGYHPNAPRVLIEWKGTEIGPGDNPDNFNSLQKMFLRTKKGLQNSHYLYFHIGAARDKPEDFQFIIHLGEIISVSK